MNNTTTFHGIYVTFLTTSRGTYEMVCHGNHYLLDAVTLEEAKTLGKLIVEQVYFGMKA